MAHLVDYAVFVLFFFVFVGEITALNTTSAKPLISNKGVTTDGVKISTSKKDVQTSSPTTKLKTSHITTQAPTTTASSNASTVRCKGKGNCKSCTKDIHCYWCESTKKCEVYPIKKIAPRDCPKNNWKWKQCIVPGYILIIVVPVIVGLFLLTCGCCIYCKCCRGNKKGWKKAEEKIRQRRRDMEQQHELRRKERQARQDAIRKKYGLLKDEDEEPLI